MARSAKKGPFIDTHLQSKITVMNQTNDKKVARPGAHHLLVAGRAHLRYLRLKMGVNERTFLCGTCHRVTPDFLTAGYGAGYDESPGCETWCFWLSNCKSFLRTDEFLTCCGG